MSALKTQFLSVSLLGHPISGMFLMRSVLPEVPRSAPNTVAHFRAIQIQLFIIQPPGNIIFTYKIQTVPAEERSAVRVVCLTSMCLREGNGQGDLASVPGCQSGLSSGHQSLIGLFTSDASAKRERKSLKKSEDKIHHRASAPFCHNVLLH